MITNKTATRLKNAGLKWMPAMHDFFFIPERGLDHLVFVISDMTISVEMMGSYPVITFNGATEWSLDYVTVWDVVWMPREDQIRQAIEVRWLGEPGCSIELEIERPIYRCNLRSDRKLRSFEAESASEVYALALEYLIRKEQRAQHSLRG